MRFDYFSANRIIILNLSILVTHSINLPIYFFKLLLFADTVIFDNTYSVLRSKKIHYCVYTTLPITKLNILPDEDLWKEELDSEEQKEEASVSNTNL